MTRLKLFALKNAMVAIAAIVNAIGQIVTSSYFEFDPQVILLHPQLMAAGAKVQFYFNPLAALFFYVCLFWYEWPIRRWLNSYFHERETDPDLTLLARRRLLNEIFFLIGLSLLVWLTAAIVFTATFWIQGAPRDMMLRVIYVPVITGLLVAILSFYFIDFGMQRWLIPIFFPRGKLWATPGAHNLRVRVRVVALIWACNFIPMLTFLLLPNRVYNSFPGDPAAAYASLRTTMAYHAIFFIAVAMSLAFFLAKNVLRPILEIIRVVRSVSQGDLTDRVRVTSNDEIGFAGDVLNEMTHGLRERERLQNSIDLAKDVQQHLLPQEPPRIPGLDIAGRSVYCDETGGDYFDYIPRGKNGAGRLAVVIGDVSDHGVPSALLMATARALVRRSCADSVDVGAVLTDANGHLSQAVEDTGQFMTLFLAEIDPASKTINWCNAGHDPGLIYNPSAEKFDEMSGDGPALGLIEDYVYQESRRDLSPGEIIILGTDGIWEAVGPEGLRFGRQGLRSLVRSHAWMSAAELVDQVIAQLRRFVQPVPFKDDVTLVVIKAEERPD